MSRAAESGQQEVEELHVALRNEGTNVWRPTLGKMVGQMTFEVLATEDYDPDLETWEFLPGMVVRARWQKLSDGLALVAWRRSSRWSR